VQGAGDFFEDGVEDAVGLFFGEVRFFPMAAASSGLRMNEAPLTVFLLLCPCCSLRNNP